MKNEFVPYDIALAMKELGFDEPCLGMYYNLEDGVKYTEPTWKFIIGKGLNNESEINAPLFQQAFRWFRENYGGYHGVSDDSFLFEFTIGGEFIRVTSTPKQRRLLNSYEEFQEACLREMIEIVKEK